MMKVDVIKFVSYHDAKEHCDLLRHRALQLYPLSGQALL